MGLKTVAVDLPQTEERNLVQSMIDKRLVHEVHTSERKSFRGCRRRWEWVFLDFYYPRTTAKPLEFGVAFHNAMEVLYEPSTWHWDRGVVLEAAKKMFTDTCTKQRDKFLNLEEATFMTYEEVQEEYADRIDLGTKMLDYYAKEVAPIYDAGWKPLKVEVEFIVPIQHPDTNEYLWCTCNRCRRTVELHYANLDESQLVEFRRNKNILGEGVWEIKIGNGEWLLWNGLPVTMAGRIDMLAEDPDGHYYIVDWKTAARLARGDASGQDRDEFLDLDDQIGSYVMALRRKIGIDVRGFVYVELKKAVPEPPQRNMQIRKGRMYSVNQQQNTDYESYLKTVMENDAQAYAAGLYDEFLAYLQTEGMNFHGRYQIIKSDAELEEIERSLFEEAAEMTDPNLRMYPSPGRFSCGTCVDSETEILTTEGWKTGYTLEESDTILTLDPKTQLSEWQPVQRVYRATGKYEMLHMENRLHSSLTTLDHRWFVQSRLSNGTRPWRFKTSDELSTIDSIPCAMPAMGLNEMQKYTDSFVELVAWYAAEGHTHDSGGIIISQSEARYPENCARIRSAIAREGSWHEHSKSNKAYKSFYIGKELADRIRSVAVGSKKVIAYEFIHDLTPSQLKLLVDTATLGDGSGYRTNRKDSYRGLCQRNREWLEPFEMACALLGIRTHLYQRKDTQWILAFNERPMVTPIHSRRNPNSVVERIEYTGLIWCPTVQNSTWLARRNGHVYYTGNCAFRQPCLEKNRQGDYQYILDTMFDRRKSHYWVKEISTDKRGGE